MPVPRKYRRGGQAEPAFILMHSDGKFFSTTTGGTTTISHTKDFTPSADTETSTMSVRRVTASADAFQNTGPDNDGTILVELNGTQQGDTQTIAGTGTEFTEFAWSFDINPNVTNTIRIKCGAGGGGSSVAVQNFRVRAVIIKSKVA